MSRNTLSFKQQNRDLKGFCGRGDKQDELYLIHTQKKYIKFILEVSNISEDFIPFQAIFSSLMKLNIRKSFLISNLLPPVQVYFNSLNIILDFHHDGADSIAIIFSRFINPKNIQQAHIQVFFFTFPVYFMPKVNKKMVQSSQSREGPYLI